MTAAQLAPFLGLDKSSISRMLAKLIEAGELEEAVAGDDARVKQLSLTRAGKRKVDQIHAYGRMQVNTAMARLNPRSARPWPRVGRLCPGLAGLPRKRRGVPARRIQSDHDPRRLPARHDRPHHRDARRVLRAPRGLRPVLRKPGRDRRGRIRRPAQPDRQPCLAGAAERPHRRLGRHRRPGPGNNHAHLRWFILDDGCRGSGVGRQLLAEAVAYCDRLGFAATRLWTFKGLDAARKLYESVGFQLVREEAGEQWVRRSRNSSSSARPRCPNAFSLLSFPGNVPER